MKVKIAELKTHLSRYIQSLREGGEPIEVCVREETVAYLSPLNNPVTDNSRQQNELVKRLEQKGLRLRQRGQVSDQILSPGKAGDGREVENSIVAIRSEKGW